METLPPSPLPVKHAGVNSAGPDRGELGSVTCLVLWGLLPWQGNLKETALFVGPSRQGAPGSLAVPGHFVDTVRGFWQKPKLSALGSGWRDLERRKLSECLDEAAGRSLCRAAQETAM